MGKYKKKKIQEEETSIWWTPDCKEENPTRSHRNSHLWPEVRGDGQVRRVQYDISSQRLDYEQYEKSQILSKWLGCERLRVNNLIIFYLERPIE